MRILYICGDQGIPAFGRKGASTHLREVIGAFRAHGHEVCLGAADLSGDRRPDEDFPVVKLPQPTSRALGIDGRYLYANYLARQVLNRVYEEFRPDAIYERSALYFTAGLGLARRHRLPRILEVNSLLSREQRQRLHFPSLAWRYEMKLLRESQAIAAISSTMARQMAELGCEPSRIRPFPMAVDPKRFKPVDDLHYRRRELGWGPNVAVLGYVGSMNSYHRPNWFMDLAEKTLRREEKGIRFLVVGGSTLKVQRHRSRLLRWVDQGLVHFTGSVPQSDMAGWMDAMDVVLVPGAAPQSTPTKIFEAAAVGRPVILPATEPVKELCGKDAIFLFRPNDFRSFEERVREFLARGDEFRKACRALHRQVITEHTWERHARDLEGWFEELRRDLLSHG